ncbi:tetratricopeptide repeat protein [Sulfurimonas sp. C5]|uniref:tetratricopeptide repeat protein n=1 Tax=Sulfurimonas sp. C5 TaxID=3036947 RepID=UPI0024554B1A|nr:tetratricopeptide repeat protein [Sulfurimonas sp. C5]MDH4944741.1 tetratricopeptide repeat protein [Sulfurimonas sp. C5]
MKKIILLFLFTLASLLAETNQACCTTVQLTSYVNTNKDLKFIQNNYPSECTTMDINGYVTVRCGCFDSISSAQEKLKELKVEYPQAQLVKSYKYRFDETCPTNQEVIAPTQQQVPMGKSEEEELRLMLQVFLYKTDLESAFQVAQIGYEQYPNSYYWNEKMATICQWTDRPARAMKHLQKMYKLKYNPIIEQKLIDYGKATYQYENIEPYVLRRVKKDPTEENIDLLITIYKKTGFPEKVIAILDEEYKKTKNPLLLTKALELALEMGDLDLAKEYVEIIELHKPYSKENAALVSRYYYILRDIHTAYLSLSDVHNSTLLEDTNSTQEVQYFELKSDLGWYLQKNLPAAQASKILIDADIGRLADYERVAIVYPDINNTYAAQAVKEGYIKYKLPYMFFSYANDAINKNKFEDLNKLLQKIDEENSPLTQEAMYWLIKAKVYNYYKQHDLEKAALQQALALSPYNTEVKTALLWHFMEMNDVNNIKLVLLELEEKSDITPSLYFSLASAYFYIHNIDRASYYMSLLDYEQDIVTQTIDYRFLQAYIYQVQNRDENFQSKIREIFTILKQQRKKNLTLKTNNDHLTNYFSAAMYVMHSDPFEQELEDAKPYLKKKNYDELKYSWSMQKEAFEKSHEIYEQTVAPERWMQFSNAMVLQHHTNTENMIDWYLSELSQGDASAQAQEDGQVSLAQTINYNFFDQNSYSQNLYIQQIDLSKLRSDTLDLKLSRYIRDPLVQHYFTAKNSSYIGDDWYVLSGFGYYQNRSSDSNVLVNVPKNTYDISLGVKKLTERASIELGLLYNHDMKNYFSFFMDTSYQFSTDFRAGLEIGKNVEADESTQLYLGGKKDHVTPKLIYNILNSTSIEAKYEFSRFYSQDNVDLGKGKYFNISVNRQLRNGYPDMRIGVFYDRGIYNETSATHGIIDTLQIEPYQVLPNNFYNIGMNFSYGEMNRNLYTRVWHPYFEIYPYYNSDINDFTFGLNAGIGGKAFHQDHMNIGVSYSDSVNGIGGKILEFYINYQFMYTLSKEI